MEYSCTGGSTGTISVGDAAVIGTGSAASRVGACDIDEAVVVEVGLAVLELEELVVETGALLEAVGSAS